MSVSTSPRAHRVQRCLGPWTPRLLGSAELPRFLSRGDRDLGVAFQTHPGRQAFISSGSKEPRSALESRRLSLGAHCVD